jgi:hypothetical protein
VGVSRPPGYPFNLNSAVDELLKKEFDGNRARGEAHPLMSSYGVDAIPFAHDDLNTWRDPFKGIRCDHSETHFTISGGVDDVWVNPRGELHVVDYKATSKSEEVTLDAAWQDGYKRQVEVYQWILRQNGFKVSPVAYFVYANGKRDREAFDARLEFDVKIIPYEGNDAWIPKTLSAMRVCLMSNSLPESGDGCDYCTYIREVSKEWSKASTQSPAKPNTSPDSLFDLG